jgi:hypothetical protein
MYLCNKYTTWYNNIIATAIARVNHIGYFEKHHIIPKSLGGTNDPINIVKLTAKEHFVCHMLLPRMTIGDHRSKMIKAAWMIATMGNKNQKRVKVKSRAYCALKRQWIEHGNLNKPKSEEHKNNMRKPKSEEHKQKISIARTGVSTGPRSDYQKQIVGAIWKGKTMAKAGCIYCKNETSLMNLTKWHGVKCKSHPDFVDRITTKQECIYCKKLVDIANHTQWHGDKCKLKST